jgi:hypothetical protein
MPKKVSKKQTVSNQDLEDFWMPCFATCPPDQQEHLIINLGNFTCIDELSS